MQKQRSRVLIGIAALVLLIAALPLVGACASKPPVEGGKLKLGLSICMTGVAAEKGSPMGHGKLDCIKYINEELGGVEGYPIEAHWYDNGYDAAKAATIVKRLMDEGCLFFTTNSSKMMTSSMEIANRAGFPGMACFSSPAVTHPPQHMYAQMPDYGDDWAAFAKYYLENIWDGDGKPKMALHLLNNSTGYGARDAARAGADALGIEIVATEEHAATTVSEIDSLTRIKGKNPDVIFISSTPAPTAVILQNAYELGIYPGVTIGCAHASFTKALVDLAGADIAEGVYGVYPTVAWGDDVPGMAKAIEYCKAEHPDDEGNLDYMTSWAEALIDAEILRQAIKNTDYEVLAKGDAAAWEATEMKGFRNVKGYDVKGLHGPVDFSNPEDHRGSKSVKVFEVKSGEIVAITGWLDAPLIKYEDFEWFGK